MARYVFAALAGCSALGCAFITLGMIAFNAMRKAGLAGIPQNEWSDLFAAVVFAAGGGGALEAV